MSYYIGIDLGTSAMKLLLMDAEGTIHNTVTKEYPLEFPQPGWSQQNPEDWKKALFNGLPELLNGFDAACVTGIGCGGQMHGLVVLDEDDNVIRPAILWNDGRTAKQVDFLNGVIGKEKLSELTANIAFAGFTAPKILWMKENEPENFAKIAKIMLPYDDKVVLTFNYSGDDRTITLHEIDGGLGHSICIPSAVVHHDKKLRSSFGSEFFYARSGLTERQIVNSAKPFKHQFAAKWWMD